jgi:hypothetical protein
LPTVQEVLQADWQEAWHCPQPPVLIESEGLLIVLICFVLAINNNPPKKSIMIIVSCLPDISNNIFAIARNDVAR